MRNKIIARTEKLTTRVLKSRAKKMGRENLINEFKGNVYQYNKAAAQMLAWGYYRRSSPLVGYGDMGCNKVNIYIIDSDGDLISLCHNVSRNRGSQMLKFYLNYERGEINCDYWENYKTGGHNSNRGLAYAPSEEKLERIKKIARSHSDYMGSERDSRTDHRCRVFMRN